MTRSRIVAFLLLCLVVWFAGLQDRALTRPDEGRYAEIPREMAVSGDWVTPRLNGLKYFEKPPLQYWATALAYELERRGIVQRACRDQSGELTQ